MVVASIRRRRVAGGGGRCEYVPVRFGLDILSRTPAATRHPAATHIVRTRLNQPSPKGHLAAK